MEQGVHPSCLLRWTSFCHGGPHSWWHRPPCTTQSAAPAPRSAGCLQRGAAPDVGISSSHAVGNAVVTGAMLHRRAATRGFVEQLPATHCSDPSPVADQPPTLSCSPVLQPCPALTDDCAAQHGGPRLLLDGREDAGRCAHAVERVRDEAQLARAARLQVGPDLGHPGADMGGGRQGQAGWCAEQRCYPRAGWAHARGHPQQATGAAADSRAQPRASSSPTWTG